MPIACIENAIDGDPFRKAIAGQPLRIPAPAYNAMLDAALALKNGRNNGRGQTINGFPEAGVILLKNATETAVDRFGILSVSAPILDADDNINEFQSSVKLQGIAPATDGPYGMFAITLQPIAKGAIGKAVISGVVVCQVDMKRSTDTFADVTPSETGYLTSNTWGAAEILWADTDGDSGDEGSGGDYDGGDDSDAGDPVWAVVRIGRASVPGGQSFAVCSYAQSFSSDGDSASPVTLSGVWTNGANLTVSDSDGTITANERGLYLAWASINAGPSPGATLTSVAATLLDSADTSLVTDTVYPRALQYATAALGDDGYEVTGVADAAIAGFTFLMCPVILDKGDTISLSLAAAITSGDVGINGYVGVQQIGPAPKTS